MCSEPVGHEVRVDRRGGVSLGVAVWRSSLPGTAALSCLLGFSVFCIHR
jgi:hypothetical protein